MIVTINTDASYHHDLKIGSFAYYIVCNEGKKQHAQVLKDARSSLDCEMKAIVNALHVLFKSEFKQIRYIIINTDCKFAINAFKGTHPRHEDVIKKYHSIVSKLRKKYDIKSRKYMEKPFLEFRYVKAHTIGADNRSKSNNRCDEAAKKVLWQHINNKNQSNEKR